MDALPDLSVLRRRHRELDARLQEPDAFADPRAGAERAREHQRLARLIAQGDAAEALAREEQDLESLAAGADPDLRRMALDELPGVRARLAASVAALRRALVPPDPNDDRNTVVEIRAGAGGEEAALFAAEIARMYQRHAERRGWSVERLAWTPSDTGGLREGIFLVKGEGVHKVLQYESGVHRVQRVPATEANGRIHTSTVTVAVLPEAEEIDVKLDPADLEITVSRASGPGGQGVNTTDSAVQVLHRPSGVIVTCADERSQLKNKTKALQILRSRLLARRQAEASAAAAEHKRSLVGAGDRSEKIRTYNFPQSRLTDHRIGYTVHSLGAAMEGDLDDLLGALAEADLSERLATLEGGKGPGG